MPDHVPTTNPIGWLAQKALEYAAWYGTWIILALFGLWVVGAIVTAIRDRHDR